MPPTDEPLPAAAERHPHLRLAVLHLREALPYVSRHEEYEKEARALILEALAELWRHADALGDDTR